MAARSLWACVPCKITFQSEAELQQHYIAEPVHPKCYVCGQAFRDIVLMLLVSSLDVLLLVSLLKIEV